MTIQEQLPWNLMNDETLSFFEAIGVNYLALNPAPDMWDGKDRVDYWKGVRALAESHGLPVDQCSGNWLE